MDATRQVGVILLAAGDSTRMARPKQLLPFRGITLIRHAVRTALETEFTPVILVLGAEAGPCGAEIADLPVHPVINSDWQEGMGTSVRVGVVELLRLAPRAEAALILLHDQPLITADRLRELVQAWRPANCAVASSYGGTLGAPALFARELFAELKALSGNQGARRILETHRDRLVVFDMPEALHDLDTPADYGRLV